MFNQNKKINKFFVSKGFALLFSVLLSSLLLTIGLSIFNLVLKELLISTSARQSIHAFYAAESGRECAYYLDLKRAFADGSSCNGVEFTFPSGGAYPPALSAGDPPVERISNLDTTFVSGVSEGPNFSVEVKKMSFYDNTKLKTIRETIITSTGHDQGGEDRVEREVEQKY